MRGIMTRHEPVRHLQTSDLSQTRRDQEIRYNNTGGCYDVAKAHM